MKAVLISIRPEWCVKIASGEKTIEVRKTRPKLETPFKCYIYCTMPRTNSQNEIIEVHSAYGRVRKHKISIGNGKVVGEFVCDRIYPVTIEENGPFSEERGCGYNELYTLAGERDALTDEQFDRYLNGKPGYGWHITEPKIYDKPLPVSAFFNECIKQDCENCGQLQYDAPRNAWWCDDKKRLTRPPQSWCYVEELI